MRSDQRHPTSRQGQQCHTLSPATSDAAAAVGTRMNTTANRTTFQITRTPNDSSGKPSVQAACYRILWLRQTITRLARYSKGETCAEFDDHRSRARSTVPGRSLPAFAVTPQMPASRMRMIRDFRTLIACSSSSIATDAAERQPCFKSSSSETGTPLSSVAWKQLAPVLLR